MKAIPSPPAALTIRDHTYLPGLDGLRGLAVLAVMQFHFLQSVDFQRSTTGVLRFGFDLLSRGWCSVDLFFVLSGFLITGILFDSKGSEHYFRNFIVRRALRIFPLFFGVLAALFIVLPPLARYSGCWLENTVGGYLKLSQHLASSQAWLWLSAANLKMISDGGHWSLGALNHFWSLAVEEHFYLVWPVVVLPFNHRMILRICVGCAFFALILRMVLLSLRFEPMVPFIFTPCRIDALAIGGAAAILLRSGESRELVRRLAPGLACAGSALVLLILFHWNKEQFVPLSVGLTLLAVTFAAWTIAASNPQPQTRLERALAHPALRFFGRYSYGLYIFHYFFASSYQRLLPIPRFAELTGSRACGILVYLILATALTLGIAIASWHLFEKHFLALKRLFPAENSASPSGGVGPSAGVVRAYV
jgi:peptidoglycan/LPS O-acetylase OafA/YrhL